MKYALPIIVVVALLFCFRVYRRRKRLSRQRYCESIPVYTLGKDPSTDRIEFHVRKRR